MIGETSLRMLELSGGRWIAICRIPSVSVWEFSALHGQLFRSYEYNACEEGRGVMALIATLKMILVVLSV